MLISTCAFFYQCQHLGRHYLSRPVRMKITMSRQEKIGFPAITICNQNAFRYCLSQFSSKTNDLYASLKREHRLRKIIPMLSHVITCYHMLTDTQHTSIRTPTCTRTSQRTYTRTHARARAHARTHARTHAHTHTHTHTHTHITFGGISCRLVTAAEKGSYHWLDDMYKEKIISTFNYTKWDVGNQSMHDVYLQHAHRKEDMIAS